MSSLKKLAGQTVIYGMGHVLPRVLNYLVLAIYLTRKFEDTSDYGIFTDLYAYTAVLLSIMVFRMDTAYFRFGSQSDDQKERGRIFGNTFLPMSFISIIIVVVLGVFDDQIATALEYPGQGHYVRWFSYILGFDAVTTLIYSKFRLANQPMRFLFYRIAGVLINISILLLCIEIVPRISPEAKSSLDNFTLIFKDLDYVFFANLISSAIVFFLMVPELFKVKFGYDAALTKRIFKYSWPLVVVAVAGNINQAAAVPLQKWWLSGSLESKKDLMGIYGGISKIAILLNLFTTAYNYAAEPFFFNNAKNEKKSLYGQAAMAYTLFASLVVLGTFLFIDQIVLLIGQSYREAIFVIPILLLAFLILGLYYNVAIWYKLSDNTLIASKISIVGALVTLGISFVFLPIIGIAASAWATLICFTVMLLMCYSLGQKYYPIDYPVKKILSIVLITAILLVVSYLLRGIVDSKLTRFIISLTLFSSYAFFVWKKYISDLLWLHLD